LNGHASLFELTADGPAGHIEGVGLRLYNPQSHQWSLNWANGKTGILGDPREGSLKMVVVYLSIRNYLMTE